jgi:hypothetical protein
VIVADSLFRGGAALDPDAADTGTVGIRELPTRRARRAGAERVDDDRRRRYVWPGWG